MKTCQYTTFRDTYKVLTIDSFLRDEPGCYVFRTRDSVYAAVGDTLYKWSNNTGLPRRVGRDPIIGGN